MLFYNFISQPVLNNQSIVLLPLCNSVTIINTGTTVLTVNSVIPLNPGTPGTNNGESITIGGNRMEILGARLDLAFAGAVGNAVVIQKVYTNDNFSKT